MTQTATQHSLGRATFREISSQPQCWSRAASQAHGLAQRLPNPGERVLALGCGTSFHIAAAYANLRERAGAGITDASTASEAPSRLREYDRVIAISRSGTTEELLRTLRVLTSAPPVTAILGDTATPIADLASDVVDLSYADEDSVVQTRFPTTVLTLLRAHLGEPDTDIAALVDSAQQAIRDFVPESAPRQITILGAGWAHALAQEAALKCREAAGMWAEAYTPGEYRHGPISAAGSETLVWALTPLTSTQVAAIAGTGARLNQSARDPQVGLVSLQMNAIAWASNVGRDADAPAYLSRSVTAI